MWSQTKTRVLVAVVLPPCVPTLSPSRAPRVCVLSAQASVCRRPVLARWHSRGVCNLQRRLLLPIGPGPQRDRVAVPCRSVERGGGGLLLAVLGRVRVPCGLDDVDGVKVRSGSVQRCRRRQLHTVPRGDVRHCRWRYLGSVQRHVSRRPLRRRRHNEYAVHRGLCRGLLLRRGIDQRDQRSVQSRNVQRGRKWCVR